MNKSGLILILVGLLLLARNFGWLSSEWLALWWPALLVVLGVWLLVSPARGAASRRTSRPKSDTQP
ncbi:DUF5668 domain-containing protein [Aquabacterium sp. A7-Y]|uniref:LiaI-LiaF-like domain-containing protein n=1 Tax=Aquabacterium sp. A7-Y TaxID=1349605 RepID=UPI00223DF18F|nr:DUF5668 domain-containing protein [Aquabacterium sp. A7-Y]MCW7537160.1 DUF5668 domain-containing protein [Aquabacterium sp. A7-Y]